MKMKMSHTLNLPFSSTLSHKPHPTLLLSCSKPVSIKFNLASKPRLLLLRCQPTETPTPEEQQQTTSETDQQTELGQQIKLERESSAPVSESGGVNEFMSGVVEEIGMIEWPEFGKVVGTTGVVLAVIAASSLVLLTLNAVLAEFSDQLFAGRGVQDFFAA